MKRIILIRHGKAEKMSPTGADADRPLLARGVHQADYLAEQFSGEYAPPVEAVYASPYARAHDTALRLAKALGRHVLDEPRLRYIEPVSAALAAIADALHRHSCCAFVGHNPQLEQLGGILVHGPTGPSIRMRTGQAIVIDVLGDITPACGVLVGSLRAEPAL